ncbi:MAG: hypothetical protein ACTSU4_02080 [Promethearchaeota archaeon]
MLVDLVQRFFRGETNKKEHGIILVIVLIFLLIMWALAQFFFKGHYSILNNTISNQGRTDYNPRGFYFFTIGCAVSGFFIIFHFLFIYKKYAPTLIWLLTFSCIAGMIGGIAFMGVGFIPGDIYKPGHSFFARLAFGAFYTSAFSLLIVMVRKVQLKESWPSLKQILIIYGVFVVLLLLTIIIPELDTLANTFNVDPRLFEWPLWQWTSFFNVLMWLINIYLIIPKEQNNEG